MATCTSAQDRYFQRLERLPPIQVASAPETEASDDEECDKPATVDAKLLGEAPPDASEVFLRQAAVLLKPGTVELEWGLGYTLQEIDFLTILPDGSMVREVTDARALLASWSVRYGLSERWQPYVTVPAGIGLFERANEARQDSETDVGLGDVGAGANYLLRDGDDQCADVVLGLSVTCPTGDSVYNSLSPNVTPLGAGFWATSVNLNFIRAYDPPVLFASVEHTHQFTREFRVEI